MSLDLIARLKKDLEEARKGYLHADHAEVGRYYLHYKQAKIVYLDACAEYVEGLLP